jgi:hypothetical protein
MALTTVRIACSCGFTSNTTFVGYGSTRYSYLGKCAWFIPLINEERRLDCVPVSIPVEYEGDAVAMDSFKNWILHNATSLVERVIVPAPGIFYSAIEGKTQTVCLECFG